jgi:hypothetical protein
MREFGCYKDLTNEAYHADKGYLSRSSLMDYDKNPYNYWAKHLNPNRPKKETTPAMMFGTLFHTYILERKEYLKNYTLRPPKVLLKDVGRDKYEEYKVICEALEREGKIVIEPDHYETLLAMENKIKSSPEAMQLIENARIENSFFWQDEHSGLLLKARPDVLHENMIVDLKTCSDASPRAFQNSMVTGGYHVQGAMCRDAVEAIEGHRIDTVINICIETKYPYNMAIYIIDELAIEEGHMKYKQLLLDMKASIAENKWVDYGIQKIGLPRWAI